MANKTVVLYRYGRFDGKWKFRLNVERTLERAVPRAAPANARRKEIGIRMALGAGPVHIVWTVSGGTLATFAPESLAEPSLICRCKET